MQAGFVAEWTSAPVAIVAGAVVLAVVGYMFLGARLKRMAYLANFPMCEVNHGI